MGTERREKFHRWPEALIILQSVVYGFGDPISKIAFEVTPVYSWLIPGVCIGLTYILNNVALSLTEATSVAFLRSLSVVFAPAFAFLIYRTRYRWQLAS